VTNNQIGNVGGPTVRVGVRGDQVNNLTVSGNNIQMKNSNSPPCYGFNYPVYLNGCSNYFVTGTSTSGGWIGVYLLDTNGGTNTVNTNVIANTGSAAIFVANNSPSQVAVATNKFGEAGLIDNTGSSAVILATGSTTNLANVTVTNNVYQGHVNHLKFYVNGANLAGANVSGNTQTQTVLPGNPHN
jgi:hypothetical protein